jgi:hypothetical protein
VQGTIKYYDGKPNPTHGFKIHPKSFGSVHIGLGETSSKMSVKNILLLLHVVQLEDKPTQNECQVFYHDQPC